MAGGSLLAWRPEDGTRIALIPRDGGPVRWSTTDAFWVWHTANAHEADDPAAGNPVVLDYAQWPRPAGLTARPRRRTSPARRHRPGRGHGAPSVVDDLTSTSRASTTGSSAAHTRAAPSRSPPGARSRTPAAATP